MLKTIFSIPMSGTHLEHTLNIPPEQWRVLDDAHRKRNNAQYEGNFEVSEGLVDSVIKISKHMLTTITAEGDLAVKS